MRWILLVLLMLVAGCGSSPVCDMGAPSCGAECTYTCTEPGASCGFRNNGIIEVPYCDLPDGAPALMETLRCDADGNPTCADPVATDPVCVCPD